MTTITIIFIFGLFIALLTLTTIIWSIFYPEKRIWPPKKYTYLTPFIVWVPTFTLFGILIFLGVLEWSEFYLPNWVRYWIGVPMIILANIAVWYEAWKFGMKQTGWAIGTLRTDGLYKFSRNPQYVADISMILGWIILSCSPMVWILWAVGILVLIAAPFSEEIWLKETYGKTYEDYLSSVRRFF